MRKKIIVTQNHNLQHDQIERLKSLGEVTFYNDYPSSEEWVRRCNEGDIICSGKYGILEKLYSIKDKFFSLPFVNIGWIDKNKIKENNLTISYTPGSNKSAVTEWVITMMLLLGRDLFCKIRVANIAKEKALEITGGVMKKNITILGMGNIGESVAKICQAFDMNITFFRRGDNLIDSVKDADFIVNCLSANESSKGILNKYFFNSLKKGSFFITTTGTDIYDINSMIDALDNGILEGVADDLGGSPNGDTNDPLYKKLLNHPKILVTPHMCYQSDLASKTTNDIMIDNIESWINKSPINLIE